MDYLQEDKAIIVLVDGNAWHPVTNVCVSLEHTLLTLWGVNHALPVGIVLDSEHIIFELGDGKYISNLLLADPHMKHI